MCGICGEIRFDGCVPNVPATVAMTRALAPRGPDGEGLLHLGVLEMWLQAHGIGG
jgi:asparagine synthase (glutamine-hydrolysing)